MTLEHGADCSQDDAGALKENTGSLIALDIPAHLQDIILPGHSPEQQLESTGKHSSNSSTTQPSPEEAASTSPDVQFHTREGVCLPWRLRKKVLHEGIGIRYLKALNAFMDPSG